MTIMDATKADVFHELQVEAEENCISIALIAPHVVDLMSAIIQRSDFIESIMGDLWELIVDIRESGDGFDLKKFLTECSKRGYTKEIGGAAAIAKIVNRAPNYAMAEYYARELARLGEIRRVEIAMYDAMQKLKRPDADPVQVVQVFQSRVEGIGNSKDAGFSNMTEIIDEIISEQERPDEEQVRPISTGLPTLDSVTGGFEAGIPRTSAEMIGRRETSVHFGCDCVVIIHEERKRLAVVQQLAALTGMRTGRQMQTTGH